MGLLPIDRAVGGRLEHGPVHLDDDAADDAGPLVVDDALAVQQPHDGRLDGGRGGGRPHPAHRRPHHDGEDGAHQQPPHRRQRTPCDGSGTQEDRRLPSVPVIEPIEDLPAGVVGMRAVGAFSVDDYTKVIEPELDRVEAGDHELRLLLHLGPDFTGFGEGAWGELTSEIRHTAFHRGAVVTDDDMVRNGLRVLKWVLRGDVRTFRNREYDRAVTWVAS